MTTKTHSIDDSMLALTTYYRSLRPWHLGWWFFPQAIASELKHGDNAAQPMLVARRVLDVFLSAGRFLSFVYRQLFGHYFDNNLLSSLKLLKTNNLWNDRSFDAVVQHQSPEALADMLWELQGACLLNQSNFDAVVSHTSPKEIDNVLDLLADERLLKQTVFDAVVSHQNPEKLSNAIEIVWEVDLLTRANFDLVVKHKNLDDLLQVLTIVRESGLITNNSRSCENFAAVVQHHDCSSLYHCLAYFSEKGFLRLLNYNTQANFDAIVTHQHTDKILSVINALRDCAWFNANANRFFSLVKHERFSQLSDLICGMKAQNLLTQKNYHAVEVYADFFGTLSASEQPCLAEMLAICQESNTAVCQQRLREYCAGRPTSSAHKTVGHVDGVGAIGIFAASSTTTSTSSEEVDERADHSSIGGEPLGLIR